MNAPPTSVAAPAGGSFERRLWAIAASIVLHLVVLALGALATAVVAGGKVPPKTLPQQPLLLTAVALVLAHCSLGGIFWSRSSVSLHGRTFVAVITAAAMWGLLLLLLQQTRASGLASSAWAASLITQAVLSGLIATGIEFWCDPVRAATRSRFSIGFVLLWTTLLAMLLGTAGAWGAQHGWKIADVVRWTFFLQLQLVGAWGALIAGVINASARLLNRISLRIVTCVLTCLVAAVVSPVLFGLIFGAEAGAEKPDIAWLFGAQGLFVIATILPLEFTHSNSDASHSSVADSDT